MVFAQFHMLPEQASTTAYEYDALAYFLTGVCGFLGLLIFSLVIIFAVRYRRRSPNEIPPQIEGSLRLETAWTVIPFFIVLVMFGWSSSVFFKMIQPPPDTLEVYGIGRQWMWHLQHADGQREINTLHVPVGRPVRVTLTSVDVIHGFYVPAFRVNHDVLPGRYVTVWFQATRTGAFDLFCSQYCGTDHSVMIGKVIVMEPDAYQRWLAEGASGSLADRGRKLFQKLNCIVCHSADARAKCPNLENIYLKRVPLQDGGFVIADDDYLRESILYPDVKVVAGYRPIMPAYEGQVSEEELLQLIVYLKQLKPGQTPSRVETGMPPEAGPALMKKER